MCLFLNNLKYLICVSCDKIVVVLFILVFLWIKFLVFLLLKVWCMLVYDLVLIFVKRMNDKVMYSDV